jgi:hypothetical protein
LIIWLLLVAVAVVALAAEEVALVDFAPEQDCL